MHLDGILEIAKWLKMHRPETDGLMRLHLQVTGTPNIWWFSLLPKQDYILDKQYLVTFVEIGLTALGYYSGAVEAPGIFGGGLETAVDKFQNDTSLNNDKVAGRNVMDMILRKMGCI